MQRKEFTEAIQWAKSHIQVDVEGNIKKQDVYSGYVLDFTSSIYSIY